jgi:GntR family transcriptional regulator/MocR family aminotransferase
VAVEADHREGGEDEGGDGEEGRYSHRRDVLVESVARHLPGLRVSGLAAGIHAVLHLPEGADEDAVVTAARARGLAVAGMRRFSVHPEPRDPRLVLGFGTTGAEAIENGIRMLAGVLRDLTD